MRIKGTAPAVAGLAVVLLAGFVLAGAPQPAMAQEKGVSVLEQRKQDEAKVKQAQTASKGKRKVPAKAAR